MSTAPRPARHTAAPGAVTLQPWSVAAARRLVEGTAPEPADAARWHPDYPLPDTVAALQLLLAAHAAMGTLDELPRWWVHEIWVAGQVVGDVGFHGPPPESGPVVVEIGYAVAPALRGRGIASAACALLLELAWRDGADRVLAETDADNVASQAVLRHNGFRRRLSGDFAVERPEGQARVSGPGGLSRRLTLDRPVLLSPVLGLHRRGAGDPTHRKLGDLYLRATRTPEGPALTKIVASGAEVSARAWGDGAEWALDQLPRLLGEDDDPAGFAPAHPILVEAVRRYGHYRVGRSDAVYEALAPACIEQVVTGKEAFRAWRLLVSEYGEVAPGPASDPASAAYEMRVPPRPEVWARVPSWKFLAAGVEERRSRTLVSTAVRAAALERTLHATPPHADRALRSLPGVGPWTSAEVRQRAHGDADAWSVGDYHVGKDITYALTGEVLDDAAATELLEPYRGHRFRVQTLLGLMGGVARRPRHAPRMTLPTHTPYATRGRS